MSTPFGSMLQTMAAAGLSCRTPDAILCRRIENPSQKALNIGEDLDRRFCFLGIHTVPEVCGVRFFDDTMRAAVESALCTVRKYVGNERILTLESFER